MASPFRVFRKHQKTLLVVAGVVLMFVFVLGDSLTAILRGLGSPGRRPGNMAAGAVAVQWDGGKLTNNELYSLVMRRRIVNDFLRGIEMEGRIAVINTGAEPQPLRVQMLVGPETPQQGVEENVVRMKLFAEAARRLGMIVSDENIKLYLQKLGRERVSAPQMRAMLSRMRSAGWAVSIDYIFEGLREEMLAHNYLASYEYALATVTPAQRWQDWLQANDRVVVEAVALPVESFLPDVPEPTDTELSAFFDLYKDYEPSPTYVTNTELPSPRPGFAIPRRVDIRYVRANFEGLLSKFEDEVTDKEIQEFYDANKELFIRADSGLSDASGMSEETAPGKSDETPADGKADAAPTEGSEPGVEAPPRSGGPTRPGSGTTRLAPDDETAPAPATDDSSRLDRPSRPSLFRLTALEETTEPPAEENAPAEGEADTDTATADSSSTSDATSTEAPAEPPVADTPTAGFDQGAAATSGEPLATGLPAVAGESPGRPVEYQPLDEVRDQIRRGLASEKVNEHLLDLMSDLKSRLNAAFSTYFGAVLDAKAAEKEPPVPPAVLADLSTLAEENGLEYGETGPASILELREVPVGKSVDADTNESLLRMMFGDELELYQPVTTFDVDNNRYLAIKVSDTPRQVPKLSDVRDEVVRAWKLQRAADLAEKHAQELAAKVNEAGATLADYFTDDPSVSVQRTDPFSWLTVGDISQTDMVLFRLSEPTGIVAAGPDFMRTVFELGDDQAGAVLNHDHSIAYVVRVVEHQDTPEQLRKAFLAEGDRWDGLPTMYQGHMREGAAVLARSFGESAGIEWVRPADQILDRDEEE